MSLNRRAFSAMLLASGATTACTSGPVRGLVGSGGTATGLNINLDRYSPLQIRVGERELAVRAYEGLSVVRQPSEPAYQAINVYIPEAYFQGESIGPYNARTAPIFLPNQVGGYMPALPGQPGMTMGPPPQPGQAARPSAMAVALSRGLVVASPGARGRTLRSSDGRWTGKAPAAIADLKAAVRWLRHQSGRMPGHMERIVSNGTSAGGALSALLGASGNSADHEPVLQAMGALPGRDDIFAVSAYCPITHLEHADAAYEWQFRGLTEFRSISIAMLDFKVERKEVLGHLDAQQQTLSRQLQAEFVAHVNGLGLRDTQGRRLQLDASGQGSLQQQVEALLMASAQQALDRGADLSGRTWLTLQGGRVQSMDFLAYARTAGRMKGLPAFDGLALESGENQLFGDSLTDKRHFTAFSKAHSSVAGTGMVDTLTVRQMDAMHYALHGATDAGLRAAPHWRIRHGTMDRDTSLAIPVLLAAALRGRGLDVDLALPWDQPHSGDYDLDELFDWIDRKVATAAA